MSTILIVDAQLKPESVDSAVEFFAEIAPETRAFEAVRLWTYASIPRTRADWCS